MKRTKCLTSNAHNDAAVGRFFGFLSTLFLLGEAFDLAERLAPPTSNFGSSLLFPLLPAVPVAVLVTVVFRWLRPRLPDLARGYRSGSLVVAAFLGVLLLWWLLRSS